jgi:zinc transport system ATP-binding protein
MQEIIRLEQVTAGYEGQQQLRDATISIGEREFIGIVGPNGGGKTTLIKVMLRLLQPMSGTVSYFRNGQPVPYLRIGYLPQYSTIDKEFPISVYETVLSGLNGEKRLMSRFTAEHHQRTRHIIGQLQLSGMEQRPIKALSGGELQRVLLARAVVSNPEVLVLDEPNTYIDRYFKDQIYDMLNDMRNRCAIIMVSHDTDYIRANADRIVHVEETLQISS